MSSKAGADEAASEEEDAAAAVAAAGAAAAGVGAGAVMSFVRWAAAALRCDETRCQIVS